MLNYEHKSEIIASRVGNLGGSDADLIASVAQDGGIKKSFTKRLAIAKGLIPPKDSIATQAMLLGDDVEMEIYKQLRATDNNMWKSNFKLTSKKFSRKNVSLIAHIDFFLQDNDAHVIKVVECKATKRNVDETRQTYKNQLYVEYCLAREYAASLPGIWKVELSLLHYDTNGMDTIADFDPAKITMKRVYFRTKLFDIDHGMDIIDSYLDGLDEYYGDDEVDAELLPENVQEQFLMMTTILTEIKEREKQVEDFKRKIYDFFVAHDIKSVKGELFNIIRVDPTTSRSFDHKRFIEDYEKEHPVKCRKLLKKYEKTTNRKGYVNIKVKQ